MEADSGSARSSRKTTEIRRPSEGRPSHSSPSSQEEGEKAINLVPPRATAVTKIWDFSRVMTGDASNLFFPGPPRVKPSYARTLHGRSTPLGGLNSDDARGRGCASGLADDLFGTNSIWSTSVRFAHWFKSWGRCSFAAGPCFSKLQHRLVRFGLGFASSRIRMWGSEMNLASLANRPTESAFA